MKAFVGVTDNSWFNFLSSIPEFDEVNFWQLSGKTLFGALNLGKPFLFKLHSPYNYIVGDGFFAHSTILPISLACEAFGIKNGVNYSAYSGGIAMKRKFKSVYQFVITLKGIKPHIWRRIQVPESYTFWDLHVAIQDVMGWFDYHLHLFEIINPSTGLKEEIGIPDEDFAFDKVTLPGWELKIADYFSMDNPKADYQYDFGDNWVHAIEFEKILPRAKNVKYPIGIAGKRACPPEDCGGIWGYQDFLEIIKNPEDEEYERMLEWVGGEFDPEDFEINDVRFDNPDKRWETAFR